MNSVWKPFLEQMTVILITLDLEGVFTSVNPKAEQIYALSEAQLIGLPFYTVLDLYSHEKAAMMLERTIAEGGVSEWELDHVQPDGPPILLGYTTSVIRDESGEPIGIGAIGVDLTSKLDLTEKLAYTNQELEGTLLKLEKTLAELKSTQSQLVQSEKMRTLGQLVAGIAHEINNPAAFVANNLAYLNKIVPNLKVLFDAYQVLMPFANSEQMQTIQQAEVDAEVEYIWDDVRDIVVESSEGIERIRKIVLSLRTFSHLDEAELKQVDLRDGLRSTLQLIRPMCKNRIEIIEDLQEIPPITCHPGELNQVFLNLLTNAVQAIEDTGEIVVSVRQQDQKLVVSVRDSGHGMDAETLNRLGEPFFTTKPVGTGTGLGLSISYGIINSHQGTLKFESEINKGTTAIVELPI